MFREYLDLLPPHWYKDEDEKYSNELTMSSTDNHPLNVYLQNRHQMIRYPGNIDPLRKMFQAADSSNYEHHHQQQQQQQQGNEYSNDNNIDNRNNVSAVNTTSSYHHHHQLEGDYHEFHCQWTEHDGTGKNNIDSSSNRSGGHTNQGDVNSRPSSTNRRKLGPPQRKLVDKNDISSLGRVSVYCVGSSINLLSLRAHVFRRGFSYNYYSKSKLESDSSSSSNASSTDSQDDVMASLPNLMLSRRPEDVALDEEVLHISNAPSLYLSSALQSSNYNNNNNHFTGNPYNGPPSKASSSTSTTIDASTVTTTSAGGADASTVGNSYKTFDNKDSVATTSTDPSLNNDPNYYYTGGDVATKASSSSSSSHTDDSSEEAPLSRTDRQLVMLTQDIFYFEYGCVVFWGLSQR